MDTIASKIPYIAESNEERGFPADSYYIIEFADGSIRDERDTNWSTFSEVKEVGGMGGKKHVSVSKYPVKAIQVFHGGLHTLLEVPDGCEVYNAFCSEVSFLPNGGKNSNINGRLVGLVRDGEVIEERFLNAREGMVVGATL